MTASAASASQDRLCLHVVDDDGKFGAPLPHFDSFMKQAGWTQQNYSLIAILGCQSSGKSTILNALFGTQFIMMDQTKGRQQTTRGIWMEASPKCPELCIMDLEGTDSAERGEDRGSFERQTGLFALALAEVLVINTWYHDLGRYTASNIGILKTIFEINLQLFKTGSKTTLLFLIRDFETDSPLEPVAEKIRKSMAEIWSTINKSSEFENTTYDQVFSLQFFTLPHKKLLAAEFDRGVEELRKWFSDSSHPSYMFNTPDHRAKSVPADGMGVYCQQLWQTIRENKDLNLPSQKEMLSTYRCEEFMEEVLRKHFPGIATLHESVSKTYNEDYGRDANALMLDAISDYDELSKAYFPSVVERKREELMSKLLEELARSFDAQMHHAILAASAYFQEQLEKSLSPDQFSTKFNSIVAQVRQDALAALQTSFDASNVSKSEWIFDKYAVELQDKIAAHVAVVRKDQVTLLTESLRKRVTETLRQMVVSDFNELADTMWNQVRNSFNKVVSSVPKLISEKVNDFELEDKENAHLVEMLQNLARDVVLQEQQSLSVHVVSLMKMKFDKVFKTDERGLTRKWKKNDDPRPLFETAVTKGMAVLEKFAEFQLIQDAVDPTVVISKEKRTEAQYIFKEKADSELMVVEERLANLAQNNIPWWMFAVLVVLGWNELMMVLTNPLLLILVIGFGTFFLVGQFASDSPVGFMFNNLLAALSGALQKAADQVSQAGANKPASGNRTRRSPSSSKSD